MHYTNLIKPKTTVEFDMEQYDETGTRMILNEKTGKPEIVEMVLNKPTLEQDKQVTAWIDEGIEGIVLHRNMVSMLLPLEDGRTEPYTEHEIDSLIMQTGGFNRDESLPKRVLALFGRDNPSHQEMLEKIIEGKLDIGEVSKKLKETKRDKTEGLEAEKDLPSS